MDNVQYFGEHTSLRTIGFALVFLCFVTACFATYSFFSSIYDSDKKSQSVWSKFGYLGFIVHGISVFSIIGLLIYIMSQKMYEFAYVQSQVSDDLPGYYIFSALWQGQEGSFLLWMFWHCILGGIILKTAHTWRPAVLGVLSSIQVGISSMLLGVYIPGLEDEKIGSNPFVFLRDTMDAPIFSNADYVSLITGAGLNPLLQNYWMIIHPPVLFLGFASVSIPFCFALGSLINKQYTAWLEPAFKWALFSCFIFGLGILMGSAWAYEALSFGGYWAWDPVENASLVPWLIGVAAIHTHLIAKHTGRAIKSTYTYYALAFLLVLYSTFLTRSGILGDTSVHAFTEMGLESQLILFILFFGIVWIFYYFKNRKFIQSPHSEEKIYSREFWLFIGALVLLFSGGLLTFSTSLPVFNKIIQIFNPDYIGHVILDPVEHHDKFQLWIGVFVAFISAFTIFFRYNEKNIQERKKQLLVHILTPLVIALLGALFIFSKLNHPQWQHGILTAAALFTIVANLDYILAFTKRRLPALPSFLSHSGFGVLLLGILFTGLNKHHISKYIRPLSPDIENKYVQLFKNKPYLMDDLLVSYVSDTLIRNQRIFNVSFKKLNIEGEVIDSFNTHPNAIYANDFTKIASWNPSTKRYLHKDIFTQISSYPAQLLDIENLKAMEDTLNFVPKFLAKNERINYDHYSIQFDGINYSPSIDPSDTTNYDMLVGMNLSFTDKDSSSTTATYEVTPAIGLKNGLIYQIPTVIEDLQLKIKLNENILNRLFSVENSLTYDDVELGLGEKIQWNGLSITLTEISQVQDTSRISAPDGDIIIQAKLLIERLEKSFVAEPIYILNGSQQISLRDFIPEVDLHVRFIKINPKTEKMTFIFAKDPNPQDQYEVLVAENVPRSDWILLEAQVFPGINLVWLGSLMLLFGFLIRVFIKK